MTLSPNDMGDTANDMGDTANDMGDTANDKGCRIQGLLDTASDTDGGR